MAPLISSSIKSNNPEYVALRDYPRNASLREIAEELWRKFSPFADPYFPEYFAENIHTRFWEMYLAVCLLDKGMDLVPKGKSYGPDIHVKLDGQDLWIEAIAPSEGSGKDAVPLIEEKPKFEPIPEDKIILRFTNAVTEKLNKRLKYVDEGGISQNDPFVVAINGKGIQMTMFDGPLLAIIKAVYPVGDYQVTFDRETLEVVSEGYQTRFEIIKASGSPVPTNMFLDTANSGISGILYSGAALWDMPNQPGAELLYIHNSIASSSLSRNWLCSIQECYLKGNELFITPTPSCA